MLLGNNRDTTPPKVNCPKVPSKYAEKGEKTAVISWPAVTSSEGYVIVLVLISYVTTGVGKFFRHMTYLRL